MSLEIERKFLLSGPPGWLGECPAVPIEQGYVAIGEGFEVRLRRAGDRSTLTVKRGGGEVREEVEVTLGPEQFQALWPLTESRRLSKKRHRKRLGEGVEVEIDVYEGRMDGLVVAEVEFSSPERSREFRAPEWLAEEVTGDERYANRSLALNGKWALEAAQAGKGKRMTTIAAKSQAFRLRRKEGISEGLRRVARGRAEKALEALRDDEGDQAEAIHTARKNLKKLRAVLRLCRHELGEQAYRAENQRHRDAGRLLSSSRDAEVRLETLDALHGRLGASFPGGVHTTWALALESERDEVVGREAATGKVGRAVEAIEAGREAIEAWPLRADGWEAIGPGLSRSYRRGRRAFAATLDRSDADSVHDWRKRAKDLTYQLRLLRRAWPELLEDTLREAKRLTDLLGDHHDLALLLQDLEGRRLGWEKELADLIGRRQDELLGEALELGRRLYAEKPKAFERRIRSYWEAWRAA